MAENIVKPRAALTMAEEGISIVDGCLISGECGVVAQLLCVEHP